MMMTQSHDHTGQCKRWWQVVNSHATIAIVRGDVCVWDLGAAAGRKGTYVQQSTAAADLVTVAGVADDAFPANDFTFVGLVQIEGYHDAVKFTGTASQTRIESGAVAGAAKAAAPSTVAILAGSFGLCFTPSGTPGTIEALLHVHL